MTKKVVLFSFLVIVFIVAIVLPFGKKRNLLKNKEIIIGNFWGDWDVNTYQPQNQNEELTVEWRKKIQKNYRVTIKEKMVGYWGVMFQTVFNYIIGGGKEVQAFIVTPECAMALQRQKFLAPLNKSRAINLKSSISLPYRHVGYNQDMAKIFTFNDKQYALTIGYGNSNHSTVVYFNKRLFREAGIDPELPYNMQKDGTWTWDNFYNISKKLTRDWNNDGIIDTYAMPADLTSEILTAFVFSNGGEFVGKDASGKFINTSGRPEFLEALYFVRKLNDEGLLMSRPKNSTWDWFVPMFTDGKVAMLIDELWRMDMFSYMSDDWGCVLPPKGPRLNNYRFPTDENVLIIPSIYEGDELDTILTAINLWFTPVSNDWKTGLYRFFRDKRAVDETMAMIHSPNYGAFKNHMLIPGMEIGDIAWHIFWWDNAPVQLIESVSQNWAALLNDANNIK